jgi:hypothetical protein
LVVLFFVELKIGVMVGVVSAFGVEGEAGEHLDEAGWILIIK